jgi:hypothetical protein
MLGSPRTLSLKRLSIVPSARRVRDRTTCSSTAIGSRPTSHLDLLPLASSSAASPASPAPHPRTRPAAGEEVGHTIRSGSTSRPTRPIAVAQLVIFSDPPRPGSSNFYSGFHHSHSFGVFTGSLKLTAPPWPSKSSYFAFSADRTRRHFTCQHQAAHAFADSCCSSSRLHQVLPDSPSLLPRT